MKQYRRIIVKPKPSSTIASRHPWVKLNSIIEQVDPPVPGEVVDLVLPDGNWLGRGIYNPNSNIRVRLLTWNQSDDIDELLISKRMETAFQLREGNAELRNLTARRLIFSEADLLSGLIVDQYGKYLVVQVASVAMHRFLDCVLDCLSARWNPEGIFLQIDERTAKLEGLEPRSEVVRGRLPTHGVELEEHGLTFHLDLAGGQKTGYYLDQRDNRKAIVPWIPAEAEVLDVCSYLGGFALTIAKWSAAKSVLGLDSSAKTIERATEHARINGMEHVQFRCDDFFDGLSSMVDEGRQFDVVVLDPPRLAGSRNQLAQALRAYHRLNYLAVRLIRPGGILCTCSCSGRVSRSDFQDMLLGVSRHARRDIQILEQRGAGADHPSLVSCPETDYLKCFLCRVF